MIMKVQCVRELARIFLAGNGIWPTAYCSQCFTDNTDHNGLKYQESQATSLGASKDPF